LINKILLSWIGLVFAMPVLAQESISDNSFLIEEAYNQDPGVVQHIHLLQYSGEESDVVCSFTQEWPLAGRKHQVSYTIPYVLSPVTELSDIQLNYRYEIYSSEKLSIAPRLTAQLPTAASIQYRGIIFSLPASIILSRKWVMHLNAGAGDLWNERIVTKQFNVGGSLVYHLSYRFDFLTEVLHNGYSRDAEGAAPPSQTLINPGFRFAFNFKSGMQIVPASSLLFDISNHVRYLLVYLSVEHPFKKIKS
jgi:hypothetical protein